jgi:hypothetical protein
MKFKERYPTEQNPLEKTSTLISQEISRILLNPKML